VLGEVAERALMRRQFYVGNTRYRGAHRIYVSPPRENPRRCHAPIPAGTRDRVRRTASAGRERTEPCSNREKMWQDLAMAARRTAVAWCPVNDGGVMSNDCVRKPRLALRHRPASGTCHVRDGKGQRRNFPWVATPRGAGLRHEADVVRVSIGIGSSSFAGANLAPLYWPSRIKCSSALRRAEVDTRKMGTSPIPSTKSDSAAGRSGAARKANELELDSDKDEIVEGDISPQLRRSENPIVSWSPFLVDRALAGAMKFASRR